MKLSIGHDFGGSLAWTLARDHGRRIRGVASLNTPYTRRGPESLDATMLRLREPDNYMVRFQEPGVAEALFEQHLGTMFERLMRRPALPLSELGWPPDHRLRALPMTLLVGEPELMGEALLTSREAGIFTSAFAATGFTGALNWYRNFRQNWLDTEKVEDRVTAPALMISAADDVFLPPKTTRDMEAYVPDLERHVIPHCGHWTQQERPREVNELLVSWLARRMR